MTGHRYIGASPERAEDRGLVRGAHAYVADIQVPGCLEACFVRSYEAHGVLGDVDVENARSVEGVVAAFAARDFEDLPETPIPARSSAPATMARPCLAKDRVRYAGEPVAITVAPDRYLAEDAAERVMVEIDPLDAVLDPELAAREDAVRLFEGHSNVATVRTYGEPLEEVFESADAVVEMKLRNDRIVPTSIEARAILVAPSEDGRITVWVSHQAPQRLRADLASALGLEPERFRVIVPKVGGAFGAKSQTFPEYVAVAHVARLLGRPIRWVEDRREALLAASHGRGQTQRLRLAARADGTLLGLEARIDSDIGGYPHTGEFIPSMTGWLLVGPYDLDRVHIVVRSVVTNAVPTTAYRGAGRPEAAYALERLVDRMARALALDPAELRRRNFIPASAFPHKTATGAEYDSGDHHAALDQALRLARYDEVRAEQSRRRSANDPQRLGIGIASWVERSGGQPGSPEFGSIEVRSDGVIVARSGSTPQGQGHETTFGQVVASVFEVPLERVRVVQGDTDEVPVGIGTFGSRSVQVGGSALHEASVEVVDDARRRAADLLEAAEEDLDYAAGSFTIAGTERSVELAELASKSPLGAESRFSPPQAFPFGSYVAIVEIDGDTGEVTIRRLVAVDDCGVVVNPKLAEGQIVGSIMQGLGQALYEKVSFDDYGQPQVSSLMDYSLPTVAELPELVLGETVTPNPNVPLGVKGTGEAGCIGTPPAIVNAIVDALDGRDDGIDLPVTPEKVWRVLVRES